MTSTLFGISNCDSVKKAKKWLDNNGTDYQFHDFRKNGLNETTVAAWLNRVDASVLVNKRSTTWKQLDECNKARADSDTLALLLEHPTLIKRPVLATATQLFVGFNEAGYQQLFNEDSP